MGRVKFDDESHTTINTSHLLTKSQADILYHNEAEDINMNNHKITGLKAAEDHNDAVNYHQLLSLTANNLDMQSNRIINVGDATQDNDALNLGQFNKLLNSFIIYQDTLKFKPIILKLDTTKIIPLALVIKINSRFESEKFGIYPNYVIMVPESPKYTTNEYIFYYISMDLENTPQEITNDDLSKFENRGPLVKPPIIQQPVQPTQSTIQEIDVSELPESIPLRYNNRSYQIQKGVLCKYQVTKATEPRGHLLFNEALEYGFVEDPYYNDLLFVENGKTLRGKKIKRFKYDGWFMRINNGKYQTKGFFSSEWTNIPAFDPYTIYVR